MRGVGWFIAVCLLIPEVASFGQGPGPDDLAYFETKVRPVLVARCYECHSGESKTLRGGLRLDSKPGWEQGGDLGPALEPGKPDESLLIQAVRWDDDTLKMPPKGKIPAEEIAVLTDWVQRGAPDPRLTVPAAVAAKPARVIDHDEGRAHWAFQPLANVEPPAVRDTAWCRSPIDRFILAKLEAQGLKPAPPASRQVLIRRLFFDLVGLPPAPGALDATPEDTIERLLASPHYGERWARHWLDLARYGESHGFEHDYDRPSAYTYRDFVIEALNRDLPYDTFVKWQLAGDELAPEEPLALKATGFLAAGVHATQITASQAEKERYDELDDILATTGTAFLGLTIGCARCHDHKFDPITNVEYYNLLATFTTTVRHEMDLDTDPEGYRKARAAYDVAHRPYLDALARFESERLPERLARWEAAGAGTAGLPWRVLELTGTKSRGSTLTAQPDGSVLATGKNVDHESYTFTATVDRPGITAIRLEALSDPSLVKGGPGRASNGNFALSDFKVTARPTADKDAKPVEVKLKSARATFEQAGFPVAAAIDNDGTSAWAIDPKFGRDHAAVFELAGPLDAASPTELQFTLTFANNLKHAIGRPRLSITTASGPVAFDAPSVPQTVEAVLAVPSDQRDAEQARALRNWYRTIDPEWQALHQAESDHARTAPRPSIVKALISTEGLPAVRLHTQGPDFYDKTFILLRGDPNQKVEEAEPGFLKVLMGSSEGEDHWGRTPPENARTSFRRASLAGWMTDVDDGAGALLARVIVNRLWQHHFGRGLVATPSDFGSQGEPPTHPELLDWLANRLIESGWSLKAIHRMVLNSAVYQQGSRNDPGPANPDVENHLLWRQNRRRLEAEVIRDAMLAVAGLLDQSFYGPGTLDLGMTRRGVYFQIKRSQLIPMMTLFDAPDALVPIAVRSETTVAPQSLFLLNSPQVRHWAGAFARRVAAADDGQGARARIERAYALAFSRPPTPAELAEGTAFLSQAALADYCQVLLSTNEFIFVE